MKNRTVIQSILIASMIFTAPFHAQAQVRGEYLDALTLQAPDVLPPIGTTEPTRSTFYLKKSALGGSIMKREEALFEGLEDFKGRVYVRYESENFTKVIQEALQKKGIEITDQRDKADVAIWGRSQYRLHVHPYLQRITVLNTNFDKNQKPTGVVGRPHEVIGALTFGSPKELVGALVRSLFYIPSSPSEWTEKQRREDFDTLWGDCYNKQTRASSCPPGFKRNNSYAYKTRMQFFELESFVKVGSQEPRKFNLVARQIDDRMATDDGMNELMIMAIEELIAGFPMKPDDAKGEPK